MRHRCLPFILLFLLVCFTGCGQTKVSGKITFPDGIPLTSGNIIFEDDKSTFSSKIQNDGSFNMGMLKDGEGIPTGQYRVAVIAVKPGDEAKERPSFLTDVKYASSRTSGLTYDIQKKTTNIEIVVEKAAGAKAK